MNLIDRDELELDTEWSDYYDGFTSYSQSQINGAVEVQAIPIPKGATNGDMIKAMFQNCEQKEHMNNGYFEMYFDNDLKNASYMRVSKNWWNAPFKRGREE